MPQRSLQKRLTRESGVPTDLFWAAASSARTGRWHLQWSDGPTVATMRQLLIAAARELTHIDAHRFEFHRIVGPVGCALAMVRHVHAGRPPLGHGSDFCEFAAQLDHADDPNQGSPDELQLAHALVSLSSATGETMSQILTQSGLMGLRTARTRTPIG